MLRETVDNQIQIGSSVSVVLQNVKRDALSARHPLGVRCNIFIRGKCRVLPGGILYRSVDDVSHTDRCNNLLSGVAFPSEGNI